MNTFKKNQIIITALAIMIAIAGYLNFTDKASINEEQYVFNNKTTDTTNETDLVPNEENLTNANVIQELTSEELANNVLTNGTEEVIALDEIENTSGDAVFVSSNAVASSYFLEAKIDREQTRAYSQEILLGVINNEQLGEEQKVDAAAKMVELQDRIEKEAAAETLLEAKGFKDVFVRMDDTGVDVVVNANQLTETELAQIADVVSRKTGVVAENIVITPLKIEQ